MWKHLIPIVFVALAAASSFFIPLTMKEKSQSADLVVVGKVVSVTRLMPDEPMVGDRYFGPSSVAVVQVSEAWKRRGKDGVTFGESLKNAIPQFIMVPCDYSFSESPSKLTENREYVMFLKELGRNYFHPLDPASMHVVSEGRVADFGMDHPPTELFKFDERSKTFETFKSRALKLISEEPPEKVKPTITPTPTSGG
ncbi:hypothetical protein N9Y42_08770 [Mariniblastus sp.]|nr:hypothetical protein [Mariniblastus sp.]